MSIAIISDTQDTSWFEQFVMRRESNSSERAQLISHLAEESLSLLIHLGDACFSPSKKNIVVFENAAQPLQKLTIEKILIPGNHDYSLFSKRAPLEIANFKTEQKWKLIQKNSLAIVILNSNKFRLRKKDWQEQSTWFEKTLNQLDNDSSIKNILVLSHHPPFTNSSATSDEKHVQETFVPPFISAKKTKVLISGHVHAYEKFIYSNKTFIVAGGGGGPRVKLTARRHQDQFVGPLPRPFHYLLIDEKQDGVEIVVKGLYKGESDAQIIERVTLT